MDPRRTQTLDALDAFIQSQSALLDTARTDIQRLREAKARAITDPTAFLENLHAQLDAPAFRLSSLPDWRVTIPKEVDWTVFEGHDPAPLQKFTLDAQQALLARNQPHPTQKSPLSDLQKLVKNARRTIIDPVLAAFAQMSDLEEDSSESEIDEEQTRREREREKIRQLKKRKIRTCGLKLPSLRMEGSTAVFIRHDVEDESMDVDISLVDENGPGNFCPKYRVTREVQKSEAPSAKSLPRKQVRKNDSNQLTPPKLSADPPPSKDNGKPKPETYKQAWSVSEQHLLEQLLEQIPEGEKYRWQKISRAMNGRRTPRQVASRVQKYFEKLKKYGIQG